MIRNTKKAFTLVELIVVITILAILGTIAFISLQGYSGEAKNSKVTSDLRNIASAIETASTRNSVTIGEVNDNTRNSTHKVAPLTDTFLWARVVNWVAATAVQLDDTSALYNVWKVKFETIGQNGEDFKDPNGNNAEYVFATLTHPEFKWYQLAGQIIVNDVKKARVTGTFYTASGATASGIIAAASATTPLLDDATIGGTTPSLY